MQKSLKERSHAGSNCRGSALVEVAVILPLLLVTLVGATDFARVMRAAIAIESAAEAGAHYGARDEKYAADANGIRNVVINELENLSNGKDASTVALAKVESERYCKCHGGGVVSCASGTCAGATAQPRTYVRVAVEQPFATLIKYPGLPHTVTLRREAHLRAK